ncbi:transposase, partial [Vibrio sp. S234-5]|uniref:IS66 family transposase n=1 Tax=Vibrio sp. S234-5 TaxID=1616781 RepID=UPI002412A574
MISFASSGESKSGGGGNVFLFIPPNYQPRKITQVEYGIKLTSSHNFAVKASRVKSYHQAIKTNIQSTPLVHVDETSHSRNDEKRLRWCWLVASEDLVYEKILYSRSTHSAKTVLDSDYCGIVVSDQYSGYNWLSPDRHQLCWAHVIRNL